MKILNHPIFSTFNWFLMKKKYERKFYELRIGYRSTILNVTFGRYNWVDKNVYLENVTLGDFSYISDNSVILEANIGKFCSIGPNVRVAPGKHPTKTFVSTHPALFSNPAYCKKNFFDIDKHSPFRHVEIGNDVWICANAVITDGVKIGDGAVIAANSVVTKDVEPYSIVGGVPAKEIRKRFEPEEIKFLLEFEWWYKSDEWIEQNADYFLNIKELIKKFKHE